MTDDFSRPNAFHPPVRGMNHYEALTPAASPPEAPPSREIFKINISGIIEKGHPMNDEQFLVELAFKPMIPNLKLRPQETQLLLAYLGEILKEREAEDEAVAGEQKAADDKTGEI